MGEKKKGFTQVPNKWIEAKLGKAFLLLVYIASKPEGWKFRNKATAKTLGFSLHVYHRLLNELERKGLIERNRTRDNGRFDSVTITVSECRFTASEKATSEKIESEETTSLSILSNSNTEIKNTEREEGKTLTQDFNNLNAEKQKAWTEEFIEGTKKAADELKAPRKVTVAFHEYWNQLDKNGVPAWKTKEFFDFKVRLKSWMRNERNGG